MHRAHLWKEWLFKQVEADWSGTPVEENPWMDADEFNTAADFWSIRPDCPSFLEPANHPPPCTAGELLRRMVTDDECIEWTGKPMAPWHGPRHGKGSGKDGKKK